jgi:hypothetical protein
LADRSARLASLLIASAVGLTACQPAPSNVPASPGPVGEPSGAPVLGIDWGRAESIERPANFQETVSPTYRSVHPVLRVPGQATMADVMALPRGGYVSIGYSPPEWTPLAWTSPDGLEWRIHLLGDTEFTFPEALASGSDGTVVAVGRSGSRPMAWTTRDGEIWQLHDVSITGTDDTPERMTTVAAGDGGFVAGGSVGPELADRHARFWTSPDGATWQRVPDDASAFADAEVRSIVSFDGGFVAVGVLGTAQQRTGSVAWISRDGAAWTRVDSPAFDGGNPASLVAAPGGGLVAVGTTVESKEAVAWTSADGHQWSRAPSEASRLYPGYAEGAGGYIRMTDVAVVGDELIGVGNFQGLQYGTATSWTSSDGVHWRQAVRAPVLQQGEFYAVTAGGPGAIAVGSFGAPDAYEPRVWVSAAR